MTKDLIIIGAGAHAHSVIDVVESRADYRVRGFVDSVQPIGGSVFGYEVLGRESDLSNILAASESELFVAVGDNFQRHLICQTIVKQVPEAIFATLIHSMAYLSERARLGDGTILMAGAVVNAGCDIGNGVIINTNSSIDHDGTIHDFASLAPGVSLGGGVLIGERSSIGLGARFIHKVRVGNDVCVGAGSLILRSVNKDSVVIFGVPAKIVRPRKPDEPYL